MSENDGRLPSDGAAAEAIRVAERWLIKQGWKYDPTDIGKRAKEILEAMYAASTPNTEAS